MIDLDEFEHRAAWLEYSDLWTRYAAEVEAARRQGYKRWEFTNAIKKRDTEQARNHGEAGTRQSKDDLPGVQRHEKEKKRPMP